MPGPKPQAIVLSEKEHEELRHLSKARSTPQVQAQRARIILLAAEHADFSNGQIAQQAGCRRRNVIKWRARWLTTHNLSDLPRLVLPGVFPPLERANVTAMACTIASEEGVSLSRWSSTELAAQAHKRLNSLQISASTIKRWLAQERIKPWRYRSWQHIHDPVEFLARARPVLDLYSRATELYRQRRWILCLDEKTSIQARRPEQSPMAASRDYPLAISPRYRRAGALHLFAALSVGDGEVYGQCKGRKRLSDFKEFISEEIIPEAKRRRMRRVSLIMDNATTHGPKSLGIWLAEQSKVHGLQIECQWLPVRASWLDQIEIWFSILQRKLLQPNYFNDLQELERRILDFIKRYNSTANPINWTYTSQQLESKLCALL